MRWHCWFLGEDVHGLRDIPRDSHQELRAPIHLPSELRSSQLFYRNNSYKLLYRNNSYDRPTGSAVKL
jgi:hypothetical protein